MCLKKEKPAARRGQATDEKDETYNDFFFLFCLDFIEKEREKEKKTENLWMEVEIDLAGIVRKCGSKQK